MRIAIPQLNYCTADIRENREMMLAAVKKALDGHADLIVFPELAVCGPMADDWLEREDFVSECRQTVDQIASQCGPMAAIIGAPNLNTENGIMYSSAFFIQNGEVCDGVHKTVLSDYDIFCESRYFVAGEDNTPIRFRNQNLRVLFDEYESESIDKHDDLLIFVSTNPFHVGSMDYRKTAMSRIAKRYGKPVISLNSVGGATSILYDGNTMAFNAKGDMVCQMTSFEEDFRIIDTANLNRMPGVTASAEEPIATLHKALVFGIQDYFRKHHFTDAVLGLSGGIDSAVVAALATEALGKEHVTGILMPSVYSTDHSVTDASDLAANLGIAHETLPIRDIYDAYLKTLAPMFKDLPFNVAEENLQARIRAALVMAVSNKFGSILLNTSNKSEVAVGYGTLYGDVCGSLSVIGDVYKTDVYRLAAHINRERTIIPENTIHKAPSAELRPGQKDGDSLPPYDVLDAIVERYVGENQSQKDIIADGFDAGTVERVIALVQRNEYKRGQCPPSIKVSRKAFGAGRKMPF